MAKRPSRPRDPNQLAKIILDIATGEAENTRPPALTAVMEARRKGGLKGGKARTERLGPRKRCQIAKRAAQARRHS